MYFSISAIELLLTLVIGISALVLYVRRDDRCRWAFAAFVCAAFAAATTPADPVSMILMFVAFFGFFTFGTRYRIGAEQDQADSEAVGSTTSHRVAIAIASLAVCLFLVGRLYLVSLSEPPFGYQAFRVWATNMTSILLFAIACVVWLHGLITRRRCLDRLEHN
jgi:hypothetical protein